MSAASWQKCFVTCDDEICQALSTFQAGSPRSPLSKGDDLCKQAGRMR